MKKGAEKIYLYNLIQTKKKQGKKTQKIEQKLYRYRHNNYILHKNDFKPVI